MSWLKASLLLLFCFVCQFVKKKNKLELSTALPFCSRHPTLYICSLAQEHSHSFLPFPSPSPRRSLFNAGFQYEHPLVLREGGGRGEGGLRIVPQQQRKRTRKC